VDKVLQVNVILEGRTDYFFYNTGHDNHITSYNIDWLIQNTYHEHHKNRVDRVMWDKVILEGQPLPVVNYNEYMNTDDGLKKHLTNLLQFGFSIISGVNIYVQYFVGIGSPVSFRKPKIRIYIQSKCCPCIQNRNKNE